MIFNLNIFLLIHGLFFNLGFYCYLKSLSGELLLVAHTHVLGSRTRALGELITVVAFKTQTNPWKLNPNPPLIVVVGRLSFDRFLVVFKLLQSHEFLFWILPGLFYLHEHRFEVLRLGRLYTLVEVIVSVSSEFARLATVVGIIFLEYLINFLKIMIPKDLSVDWDINVKAFNFV